MLLAFINEDVIETSNSAINYNNLLTSEDFPTFSSDNVSEPLDIEAQAS